MLAGAAPIVCTIVAPVYCIVALTGKLTLNNIDILA